MQGAVNEEQYPELIEMLLSSDTQTFQERLQSFVDQLPDNKRSANKKGFFPLFVLGGFLALPDTKLGRDLGVKQVYYHVEKNTVGYISGVKFVIPIEKQDNKKLLFVVVSENPHIQFTPEEISYMRSKLGHDRYDSFSKIGYSIPIEHPSPTEYHSNVKIGKIKGIDRQTFTQKRVSIDTGKDFLLLKNRIRKVGEDLENLISECSSSNEEKVQNGIKEVSNYFDSIAQKYIIEKSGNFKRESDYHGLLAGFFVMLFKYRYNLKSYLELSLGEGFSDIVVLVRSTERSDNSIPIIIELKVGKTLIIQGAPFDQVKKYAEAFKYGPQRMITNNANVIYAVYNPDLPNNRIRIDKTARDRQHPKPFVQSVLESAADMSEIREQLKYIYYSIPNQSSSYYDYTSRILLGQLIPIRTQEGLWNQYVFKYGGEVERMRGQERTTDISKDITTFGFMSSNKNKLLLLNIVRSDAKNIVDRRVDIGTKKANVDEIVGRHKNIEIKEINLLLRTGKSNFQDWCNDVQIKSYNNLDEYNVGRTQNFNGAFAKLDINVNKVKGMLDKAVDKRGAGTRSDNAEHYQELFGELSRILFPVKDVINSEIDFQAILHGLFMYHSDSQMSTARKRVGVISEVQTGGGKRIDIGVVGRDEFTGTEIKFDETQGTDTSRLTTKAQEAEDQLMRYRQQPNNIKSLTDSESAKLFWAVFHKGATVPKALIETRSRFNVFQVVHSSMHVIPHPEQEDILEQSMDIFNQQCNGNRRKRNIGMLCVDSSDKEKITEEEKEQRIKKLFSTDKVVEKVKNIEFYDQLFKVSQKISKGEIIDKNVEEAFVAKIKDIDLDSIDPEIRDIVKEMKDNIENKEKVKNILRRSGVAEKIGKVAEGAGLAFTAFLVGKHIASGDIEGLGYDAFNLWVMPKIGEKISGKMLELGTKLDSQMLKGFAPVMGRAIGNFAAFLGLAESIKARQSATGPADIKIADLNIATNSIFIAADVPAVVTETMSVSGLETGVAGEFAGPVGAAVSVAVIIISQFVEAGLEVEKLEEYINLTDQEKHDLYWDLFLGKKVPDHIEHDMEARNIYKQYISKILDQFKSSCDTIAISLPSILTTKEKYATNDNSRKKRQGEEITNWLRVYYECHEKTRVINRELDFKLVTSITHPYDDGMNHYSRIIPSMIENYNVICGPLDDNIGSFESEHYVTRDLEDLLDTKACRNFPPHSQKLLSYIEEKSSFLKYSGGCSNAVTYRNKNSRGYGSVYYISAQNANVNIVFQEKDILNGDRDRRDNIENRYYFEKSLDSCKVYSPGKNFFHIAGKFSCDLGADGQKNIVITQGNLTTDSINIHSIIGSNRTNYLEFFNVDYVDGKGGNDVITAKNFTTIKGYFGDSIHGKGLVLLPINFNDIDNITHVNNITTIYNKSGAFISVDKQTSVKTADGLFVTLTKIDDKTGVVTNLHVTKSLSGDIVLDDELDNLRKIDNSNFNITKQLSSANYHSTIGSSSNHIFYPDKEHHNFYWEAPSNISHLYLFDNRNANITIAQANGILDFSQLNCTLDGIPFIENKKGEIKINKNSLNVTLLPDYKDVTVTFDGQEYYKLQNGELERDYCSHSLRIDGRFSVNGTDLLNHHNCFTFDSEKVLFLKLNNNLLLLSDRGALSISDYYSSVHKNWDLSIGLNNRIMEPEEFGERADEFSSFRYYQPDEQGLQIYHNQPINQNNIGLVDLKGKSILDFNMRVMNDTLLLSHKNNTLVKVENWNTHQPAREMMFAFNDAIVSNSRCIASTCNSEDVIVEFNKEKLVLSTEELFDAVKQNNLGKVRNLLSIGIDINIRDRRGWAPLHYASENDNKLDTSRAILNLNANIEAKTNIGETPLHIANAYGQLKIIELLIDKRANIEAKTNDGLTPLHVAIQHNNTTPKIIEFLIDKGVNIEAKIKDDQTPLHHAVFKDRLDIVRVLSSRGANIEAKTSDGKTPLDLAIQGNYTDIVGFLKQTELDKKLLTATENGDLSEVKKFVGQGASVNAIEVGIFGRKPIHIAAEKNYKDIIEFLLGKGVSVDDTSNYGWTPLHYTASKGCLEVAKFLIDKGANIDAQNVYGREPIHIAAEHDNKNIIELLLSKGISINEIDKDGWMPLHWASWNGHLNIIEYLVGKGANINTKDRNGKTPLDIARDKGHNNVVEYLQQTQLSLDKQFFTAVQDGSLNEVKDFVSRGANINAKDKDGKTPLHYASQSFHRLDIVKYLISKDADIDAKDSNDRTPLDVADSSIIKILRQAHLDKELLITVQSSDLERIKSLIAQGVSKDEHGAYYFAWIGNLGTVKFIVENEGGVNVTDKYGCTLLHWAARGGHLEIVKFLLEKGANINARSILGRTPIHVAAINNRKNIVEFFISKGADINDADKDGWTPLHWAASRGNLEVTKFLVEKGANINAENVFGRKPIHRAAEDNHKNIIDFLLSKGVSVDDADKQGHTPLYWASWGGHLDMVKYLIGTGADINAKDKGGKTPLDIAKDKGHNNIVEYLEKRLREERGEPLQRKRRHHHGDHNHHHMSRKPLAIDSSNQPEIATSSAIKPSSWINDLFNWVKGSVGGLLNSKPTLSKETSNTSSPISQVDAKMDVNGTIMLLDVLVRKVTGQKYVSTVDQPISSLKAQGYALNITNRFEKVVEQAALKSGISMHRLNIDYMGMQKEITRKVMRGKFNEISGILKSYVEKACPGEEAGKLSPKKFEKFIAQFNKGLLNQSIEQILHNKDGTLEVGGAKQMSLEPQSYLSNACVQSHSKVSTCLSEIGVTKLGGNLNR